MTAPTPSSSAILPLPPARRHRCAGYGQPNKNRLRLFDLASVDDGLVPGSSIDFDKTEIAKNLTLFLYPDDSDEQGRLLRIYQEYFMVSSTAQLLIGEAVERGSPCTTWPTTP